MARNNGILRPRRGYFDTAAELYLRCVPIQRRGRDSNPRGFRLPTFEAGALDQLCDLSTLKPVFDPLKATKIITYPVDARPVPDAPAPQTPLRESAVDAMLPCVQNAAEFR